MLKLENHAKKMVNYYLYNHMYVLGVYEICCTEKPLKELPNTKGDGQLLGTFSTLIGPLNTCVYIIPVYVTY